MPFCLLFAPFLGSRAIVAPILTVLNASCLKAARPDYTHERVLQAGSCDEPPGYSYGCPGIVIP